MRLRYLAPALFFAIVAAALFVGLSLNPREIPSALVGKPAPDFALPPVQGGKLGLADEDLKGEVSLVNVFASWCGPCRVEHPLLVELARQGVTVHGINYKDRPEAARDWLNRLGDPYTRTAADLDGRVGIEWGVYGVPETFVIAADGTVACKHIGPLMPHDVETKIKPLLAALKANGGTGRTC